MDDLGQSDMPQSEDFIYKKSRPKIKAGF